MEADEQLFAQEPICYSGCSVYRKHYYSLKPYQWLRSEAIQILTTILAQQYPCPRTKVIDPFITEMLVFVRDEQFLLTLKKHGYLIEYDYLLFPINTEESQDGNGSHWYLLVYHVKDQILVQYDSLHQNRNYQPSKIIRQRLQEMSDLFYSAKIQIKLSLACKVPKQTNTFDCGVFVIGYIEAILTQLSKGKVVSSEGLVIDESFQGRREKYRQKLQNFLRQKSKQIHDAKKQ